MRGQMMFVPYIVPYSSGSSDKKQANRGHDQVLLVSKKSIDEVGKIVVETLSKGFSFANGQVKYFEKPFGDSAIIFGISCVVFLILNLLLILVTGSLSPQYQYPQINFSLIGLGAFCLALIYFIVTWGWQPVDWIRLSELQDGTRVLIKVYDSHGNRNLDEDELMDLATALKG